MFTDCFEDWILIFLEALFITFSSIIFVQYNKIIAESICKATQIPYDLSLTAMSPGFGNEIIILLIVVELVFIVLFIEKLIPMLVNKLIWG